MNDIMTRLRDAEYDLWCMQQQRDTLDQEISLLEDEIKGLETQLELGGN